MAGVTLARPVPWDEQEQRGRVREREGDEEREQGRARFDQREEDVEMPLRDDDGEELAALQAVDAARGALQGDQRDGSSAIEGFIQGRNAEASGTLLQLAHPHAATPQTPKTSQTPRQTHTCASVRHSI